MRFEKVNYTQFHKDAIVIDNYREQLFFDLMMRYMNYPKTSGGISAGIAKIYEEIKLPKRSTIGSAGYDFFLPIDITLYPGDVITIPTGIKWNPRENNKLPWESPKTVYKYTLYIYPRSSLGRDYCLREPNLVSIIDPDYYNNEGNEGHIFINLINDGKKDIDLVAGTKYAQGVITRFYVTEDDEVTEIRKGGFGSTN